MRQLTAGEWTFEGGLNRNSAVGSDGYPSRYPLGTGQS